MTVGSYSIKGTMSFFCETHFVCVFTIHSVHVTSWIYGIAINSIKVYFDTSKVWETPVVLTSISSWPCIYIFHNPHWELFLWMIIVLFHVGGVEPMDHSLTWVNGQPPIWSTSFIESWVWAKCIAIVDVCSVQKEFVAVSTEAFVSMLNSRVDNISDLLKWEFSRQLLEEKFRSDRNLEIKIRNKSSIKKPVYSTDMKRWEHWK